MIKTYTIPTPRMDSFGMLVQVDHALQLHTTDNVSVITVCFRDTPPPRRLPREVKMPCRLH